jgi:hypothetical protein
LKRWAYFRRKEELIRISALKTPKPKVLPGIIG